jgi:hypothetical protein
MRGFCHVEGDVVFQEAELLQALGLFEDGGGEGGEAFERGAAIGVEAEVLPVRSLAAGVTVKGNGRAGEVERATIGGGNDFDGVGVGDVFRRAGDFEGGDLDVRSGEGCEDGGDVFWLEQGFIALDVDVNVGGDGAGGGEEAVCAAGEVGRGEDAGPALGVAEGLDFERVGGDDDVIEFRTGLGGAVDPGEQRVAGDIAEDLARETGGGEACGDDADDAAERRGHRSPSWFFRKLLMARTITMTSMKPRMPATS